MFCRLGVGLATVFLAFLQSGAIVSAQTRNGDELLGPVEMFRGLARRDAERKRPRLEKSQASKTRWTTLAPVHGVGGTVCNNAGDKYSCFAIRCSEDGQAEFAFFYNVGTYPETVEATVTVDNGYSSTISMRHTSTLAMRGDADLPRHHALVEALKAGRSFVFDPGFRHVFTLAGSSAQIERTLAQCGSGDAVTVVENAPTKARTESREDRPGFELLFDTDLEGHDLRDGRDDPSLRGVNSNQCAEFCESDEACKAYTHNGNNDVCLLKSDATIRKPFRGATSGIFHEKSKPEPSRSSGELIYTSGLYWQRDDTPSAYVSRLRASAVRLGGACDAERKNLESLAAALAVDFPTSRATATQPLKIAWSGNPRDASIPAYLVVAVDAPVRFEGKGFIALTPGAIAPFGIETADTQGRAVVGLHSRGAGATGSVSVIPLTAGRSKVTVTVVGYLRACKNVVELRTWSSDIEVEAADPRIVLRDAAASNLYDRRIEIPEFGRVVLFNDTRFTILDAATGSEVLEREGQDIALSPTKRFLAVSSNFNFDLIDIVDGAKVATVGGEDLAWFNNDSFAISEAEPWGRTWLASTLSNGLRVNEQRTSCASCSSSTTAVMNLDLENMLGIVAGPLGYSIFDLQDNEFQSSDRNLIIADPGLAIVTKLASQKALQIGVVSPLDMETNWNTPLGLSFSHYSGNRSTGGDLDARNAWLASLLLPRDYIKQNSRVAQADSLIGKTEDVSVLRGLAPIRSGLASETVSRRKLVEALEGFGFFAAQSNMPDFSVHAGNTDADGATKAWKLLRADLRARKLPVKLATPPAEELGMYCEDFDDRIQRGELPSVIAQANRFQVGNRAIWALGGTCGGGATASTQMSTSYFAILDTAQPTAIRDIDKAIVAQAQSLGSEHVNQFHELDLRVKLIGGDRLLFFAPGRGAIGLFELSTRTFSFQRIDLPRGDLLKDAFIDPAGEHILQENSDGTFYLYRVQDQTIILSGRFIDDEVVFWNDKYQFDATPEGGAFVHLRFPGSGGQYSFQQFDKGLRVKGLMEAVLSGRNIVGKPSIAMPPSLEGVLNIVNGEITGKVLATGTRPVVAVHIYQDGFLTDTISLASGGATLDIKVKRLRGARWVSVVAENADGLQSLPVGRDFGPDDELPPTAVLAIGIDKYDDAGISQLAFAKSDAKRIAAQFEALSGTTIDADPNGIVTLTDHAASKEAILAAAKDLADRVGPGENAVFFFAGHGVKGADEKFYIATSATRAENVENTSLSWDELALVLSRSKGRLIVLLDACHSGAVGTGLFATNDDAVDGLQRSIPSGLVVLSASKGRELSGESPGVGGGVFTTALTTVLGEGRSRADINGNGALEVSELFRAVKIAVSQQRQGLQTPWLARNELVGEFSLF